MLGQNQNPKEKSVSDPSVTVVISRRVKSEYKAEFELFLSGITQACGKFQGHLGTNIFRPVNADDPEYRIIFKFDRLSNLRNWEMSPERKYWFDIAKPLTVSPPEIQVITGLETWFTLPHSPSITPPPRYKMMIVTWLAVFPLITLISATLQRLLVNLPLVIRVALVTAIAVPTMTYLLMPQMTRLFASWLYPPVDIAAPIVEPTPNMLESAKFTSVLPELQTAETDLV